MSLLAALLLATGSCASDGRVTDPAGPDAAPTLIFDPSDEADFFDLPFPLDSRRHADGHPDLRRFPNPLGVGFVQLAIETSDRFCRGFAPSGVVTFRFNGQLPALPEDPLASTSPGAPVMLVNVDPWSGDFLRPHPVHLRQTEQADTIRPAHLLQLLPVPGLLLRPNTTYAALVLRDWGDDRPPLGAHPALGALLADQPAPVVDDDQAGVGQTDALALAFLPLRRALPRLGLRPEQIAAATVFTTEDPTADMRAQIEDARTQPVLRVLELQRHVQQRDYTVLRGVLEVPLYQQGWPPYLLFGGEQILDQRGMPVVQDTARAEFELSVPHGPMPAAGFPLYFVVHGTGGEARQLSERGYRSAVDAPARPGSTQADLISPLGWAGASMDGPYSPNRIGLRALDGYAAYNFFRPQVMRANFFQMMLEQVRFLDLLRTLRIDPALVPGADASVGSSGGARFDPELTVVGGQSLGSYLSGMLAATVDGFKGAILTGAGGSWIEFAFGPKDPVDLLALLEELTLAGGEHYDRFHPFLTLFEMAVGSADNLHYTSQILRWPAFGYRPPHLLVIEGHVDLQVPTNLQRALVLSLGADMLGGDVGATRDDRLEPVLPWAGLRQLRGAAQGNVRLRSGEPRTAVVVRYPEDGILEGHYVVYQHPQPRRQIADFLQALQRGEAPLVQDYSGDFAGGAR